MSISTEITKLNTNLTASYTACSNKGAILPASQNFDNLASTISAIPAATEPTLASLTITPSTTAQTITPPSGTDGYNTVIASAVTAAIDSDIVAGNIKSGVNILGVNGSLTELKGETRTVSITSSSGNTFTPSSGKNGITSIKCNPTNKALTITPSKTVQTLSVPSNYSGYGTVKCNAVTSSIDSNIIAGNIKSGVSILGVTGNYTGSGGGGGSYTVLNTYNIELEDTEEGSVPLYGDLFDYTEFYLVLNNNSPVAYYTVSNNYTNVCDDGTNGFLTFSYMSDTASYNERSNDFFVTCIARYNSSSGYAIFNLYAVFN